MDNKLENLYITIVESSTRTNYFAVSDSETEALSEIKGTDLCSIQNALNRALSLYKDKVKRIELGLSGEEPD